MPVIGLSGDDAVTPSDVGPGLGSVVRLGWFA